MTPVIQIRAASLLKPHPINAEIYADSPDAAFVESIKQNGVLEPLLVTADDGIISGHRRHQACLAAEITDVPVIVSDVTDKFELIELLLDSNRQRVKTNEQFGHEAQWRFKIERDKARRRQATAHAGKNGGEPLPAKSPEGIGDARDAVAKKLGMGAKKVVQLMAVVDAIKRLKESGDDDQALNLRNVLNDKSANAAFNMAKKDGYLEASGPDESKVRRLPEDTSKPEAPDLEKAALIAKIKRNIVPVLEGMSLERLSTLEMSLRNARELNEQHGCAVGISLIDPLPENWQSKPPASATANSKTAKRPKDRRS